MFIDVYMEKQVLHMLSNWCLFFDYFPCLFRARESQLFAFDKHPLIMTSFLIAYERVSNFDQTLMDSQLVNASARSHLLGLCWKLRSCEFLWDIKPSLGKCEHLEHSI